MVGRGAKRELQFNRLSARFDRLAKMAPFLQQKMLYWLQKRRDRMKKVILGLCLILAAVFLLFKDSVQLPMVDIPLWILICSAVFIIGAISSLSEKNYQGAIGSLAILFIILNSYYEWVNVATGSWIAAFVLGAIGLQLLLNKDKKD